MLEDGTRPEPFDIREWIFGDGCAGQQAERACHSRDTIQQAPRESGADADAFLKATIQGTKYSYRHPCFTPSRICAAQITERNEGNKTGNAPSFSSFETNVNRRWLERTDHKV